MKIENASNCLAKLGHSTNLSIYRLLVQAGHRGLTVGEIGKRLGITPTTLNHHFRVVDSFKTVCEQIELFRVTVLHVDRLPFKIRTLVWNFWGEPSRVEDFWKECWETGRLLLEWISFAFLLEILIVVPIPAEKVTQWFGGDSGGQSLSARQLSFRLTSTIIR